MRKLKARTVQIPERLSSALVKLPDGEKFSMKWIPGESSSIEIEIRVKFK